MSLEAPISAKLPDTTSSAGITGHNVFVPVQGDDCTPVEDAHPAPRSARPHLAFLDAMRGLAALYVAVGHAYATIRPQIDFSQVHPWAISLLKLTDLGHYAVALFIVLSGFCLMLPVVRTSDNRLPGGTWQFLIRRTRRILPPYYAALVFSIALMLLLTVIAEAGIQVNDAQGLSLGSVVSHALLIHNLFPGWSETINGPMWSVALEYQIYFLFPLLLLPVWRRWGSTACLGVAFALGLVPLLLPRQYNLEWTFTWYVGLFALGMLGAGIACSDRSGFAGIRRRLPWGPISACLVSAVLAGLTLRARWCWSRLWLTDAVVGLAATSVIVFCAGQMSTGKRASGVLRLLNSKPLVGLGTFSYSLYLVHMPIMILTSELMRNSGMNPMVRLAGQTVAVVPVCIAAAYFFYVWFEKPYIASRRTA